MKVQSKMHGNLNGSKLVAMTAMIALAFIFLAVSFAHVSFAADQNPQETIQKIEALNWQRGPGTARLGDTATVKLTNGLMALGSSDTSLFLQLNENPPTSNAYLVSASDFSWFSVFEFNPTGHIKDDEKIDPDELLNELKSQNVKGIEERKRLNLAPLFLEGWSVPPHYDIRTKQLEWGTKLRDDKGEITVNYSTRILGRTGVMSAMLVSNPANLDKNVNSFHALLEGFNFAGGQKYAEFRPGDKVAEYGLAALIVGGLPP